MKTKTILSIGLAALLITGCQTSNLRGKAHVGYEKYVKAQNHKAFFVFETPDNGFVYGYAYNRGTRAAAYNAASIKCNKLFDQVNFNGRCRPYAIDDIKVSSMTKEEIKKLLDLPIAAKSQASSDVIKKTRKKAEKTFDLYGTWENVSQNVSGTVVPNENTPSNFNLHIMLGDVKCAGNATLTGGAYNTDTPPEGVWAASCSDGKRATGTYRSFKPGSGMVKGMDNKGQKIDLMYQQQS